MSEDVMTMFSAIVATAGLATTAISQILFYRKDSKAMDEIKSSVSSGQKDLHDQVDHKQEYLSGEHKEINEVVREIRTRQEQELKIQEKIRDTVPDAGIIKDGIDKICRENAGLKEEVVKLQNQVAKLEEKNRRLVKEIKQERIRSEDMQR